MPGVSGAGWLTASEAEVVAGEGAPDGLAEVAVDAALAAVVAGGHGDHLLVAGVAVVVDALVAVAGREQDRRSPCRRGRGDGVVDRQPGAAGIGGTAGVPRVVRVEPAPSRRPPAAGDDVGAVVGGPAEGVRLLLRPEGGGQPDRHQPRRGRHAGGAVLPSAQATPAQAVPWLSGNSGRSFGRGSSLASVASRGATTLPGWRTPGGRCRRRRRSTAIVTPSPSGDLRAPPRRWRWRRRTSSTVVAFRCHCWREDRLRAAAADQLGVAVLDVGPRQELERRCRRPRAGALRRGDEEGVGGVVELLLDGQARLAQDRPAVLRVGGVDELDEQVLGVEDRLAGLVDQDAAGEPDVGAAQRPLRLERSVAAPVGRGRPRPRPRETRAPARRRRPRRPRAGDRPGDKDRVERVRTAIRSSPLFWKVTAGSVFFSPNLTSGIRPPWSAVRGRDEQYSDAACDAPDPVAKSSQRGDDRRASRFARARVAQLDRASAS